MKIFLGIDTTPPSLERSISAASKLKGELATDLQMESIPLNIFHPWPRIFKLKHEKHHKILTFTCESSWVLIRPCKTYSVNS